MREIKFRAWDTEDPMLDMMNVCVLDMELGVICVRKDNDDTFDLSTESIVLMQYTGFKDKNGKEIYEGDIFKSSGEVWVVAWNEDHACYLYENPKWNKNQHGYQLTCDVACDIEVIGNIHQNKELIPDKV